MRPTMKTLCLALTALILLAGGCPAAENTDAALLIRNSSGWHLTARQAPLWQVLTEIRRRTGVETAGLKARHRETVDLETDAGSVEALFRRLLHHLDERNFAMEYSASRLTRIRVFPGSPIRAGAARTKTSEEEDSASATTEVVRVQRVLADTQAERIGLREGDFVIAYDGVMIHDHDRLIELTNRTDPGDEVEMVIARDYEARRLTVNGGTIGIGIRTIRIFKEEYEIYADAIP